MTLSIATAQANTLDLDTLRTRVLRMRVLATICDTDNGATTFEVVKLSDGSCLVRCTREEYLYWCEDELTAIQLWLGNAADEKTKEGRFWKEASIVMGSADTDKYMPLHR